MRKADFRYFSIPITFFIPGSLSGIKCRAHITRKCNEHIPVFPMVFQKPVPIRVRCRDPTIPCHTKLHPFWEFPVPDIFSISGPGPEPHDPISHVIHQKPLNPTLQFFFFFFFFKFIYSDESMLSNLSVQCRILQCESIATM